MTDAFGAAGRLTAAAAAEPCWHEEYTDSTVLVARVANLSLLAGGPPGEELLQLHHIVQQLDEVVLRCSEHLWCD
jgi:hypothetical protein